MLGRAEVAQRRRLRWAKCRMLSDVALQSEGPSALGAKEEVPQGWPADGLPTRHFAVDGVSVGQRRQPRPKEAGAELRH